MSDKCARLRLKIENLIKNKKKPREYSQSKGNGLVLHGWWWFVVRTTWEKMD